MTSSNEWQAIMRELSGRRLAVLDELASHEPIDTANPKVQAALGWLVYHCFVWHNGRGYSARPTPEARAHYLKNGPAKEAAADVARHMDFAVAAPVPTAAGPVLAANPAPQKRAAQEELFA